MSTHIWIPDTQVKPNTPDIHLKWVGQYILDQRNKDPKIIMGGDWYDLPSLSSYDRGKASFEGRRYWDDVEAGHRALNLMMQPLTDHNRRMREQKMRQWFPEMHYLLGNHEHRADRAAEESPELEGTIGTHTFREYWEKHGWNTHGFLEVLDLDGIWYSHYFYNPMSGRPWGGMIETRLKSIGQSFTQGHQQTLMHGIRYVGNQQQHGLVAGACYLHDEDYKGPQGNHHWRGIVVKHEVRGGAYDPMFVSLNFLCMKYEGVTLDEYMREELAA